MPAATASRTNAMFSGVFVSRLVPSPIRASGVPPSVTVAMSVTVTPCEGRRTRRGRRWRRRLFGSPPPGRNLQPVLVDRPVATSTGAAFLALQAGLPRRGVLRGIGGGRCLLSEALEDAV